MDRSGDKRTKSNIEGNGWESLTSASKGLDTEVPKYSVPNREGFLSGGAPGEYQYQKRIRKQSVNAVPPRRGSVQDNGDSTRERRAHCQESLE